MRRQKSLLVTPKRFNTEEFEKGHPAGGPQTADKPLALAGGL